MNTVRSNNLSLKYQRFSSSGWNDIGIRKFDFVAKSQFLCNLLILKIDINKYVDILSVISGMYLQLISPVFFISIQSDTSISLTKGGWRVLKDLREQI